MKTLAPVDTRFTQVVLYEDCATQIVTSCSGAIALSVGGSQRCYCNADTVYTSSTADASAFLWIGCNDETGVLYFQVKPATTNHVTFDSTVRSRASSNSPSTTPSLAGQTASPTPTKASEPAAASKAWIAGVVVGGLALVAIAGLVFWLLRTRKRSKGQGYHSTPETAPYPQQYQIGHQTTLPAQPYYSSSPNQPQVHPQQDYKGQFVTTPPTQGETYKHNPNYTSVKVTIPGELSPQNNPIADTHDNPNYIVSFSKTLLHCELERLFLLCT
ncbi:uncharacterized protein BDR25DRAFT_358757 [Lindgomyces ingoldianus]|uniref:Uncharacterized protein n=1 Tax=Lindgomyces ingoldianus TaxID=673940 RepID=A0ACB6QM34_9PLEO|nr:uncharacterized protein BDR25DRAFT_358757 [Lindgomyces ingoldianus]KAF2467211.1 hypothetical protein BDR25DRAFT_358757 [Lindgomyces ingoldianus]